MNQNQEGAGKIEIENKITNSVRNPLQNIKLQGP